MELPSKEDCVKRRRERGRRSQAAFRQRQAQSVQKLAEENLNLKRGIEELLAAASGDESAHLLAKISQLGSLAGISTEGLEKQKQKQRQADPADPADPAPPNPRSTRIQGGVDEASECNSNKGAPTPSTLHQGSTAPRLNCGIWLDPLRQKQVTLPPQDILPYLGPGSKTFAGCVFWSVMDHAQDGCSRSHSEPAVLIRRGLGHSKVTENVGVTFIQRMIVARLQYKEFGVISAEYAVPAEEDLGMVVRDQISREYQARGKDPARWLSSLAIEKRVRNMVGGATFELLEKAAQGEGRAELCGIMDDVKCKLYENSVCFGDGPRWSVDLIDGLFLDWIQTVLSTAL